MKKSLYILLTCILATSLTAGTVLAKPEHAGNGQEKKQAEGQQPQPGKSGEAPGQNQEKETGGSTAKEPEQSAGGSTAKKPEKSAGEQAAGNSKDSNALTREASREVPENAKDAKDNKGASKDKAAALNKTTVTETTYKETVTSATYKGHNGYRGLLNAISHNSGKPAGAVLADLLLNKYSAKLTPEMVARLESIREQDKALIAAAEMLEHGGSVTEAVYVQQEAILADVKNLDSYKKLGKLYEKQGKKSSKLFVNGMELSGAAAPLVRGGSTLVPLRTIAEALEADVKWSPEGKAVTVSREGVTVTLTAGSKTADVNGRQVKLQTPAAVVNGSTVVPARLIAEAFKATVLWESYSKSVVIYEE